MPPVQVVGVGMAALDFLIRTRELPGWERGADLSAMALEGGGPVATALVAAQRLGVQTGIPCFDEAIRFLERRGYSLE